MRSVMDRLRSTYFLFQFYGPLKALEILIKEEIFFIGTTCRLDKDISVTSERVEPEIPVGIEIYDKSLDLNAWKGRDEMKKERGGLGLMQMRKRLDNGDLCFTAFSESKIAGFIWIEFPPAKYAGYPLKSDEAYTYDALTFVDFRGKRIFAILEQAAIDYLRKQRPDIRYLVCHVDIWNKSSLFGIQHAGFRIISLEREIVFFGYRRRIRLKTKVPENLILIK